MKKKLIESEEMRAVCITSGNGVELKKVPVPTRTEPRHLVIKILACGINPGDKAFIGGAFPPGSIPVSLHDICGVSGAGKVIEVGDVMFSACAVQNSGN